MTEVARQVNIESLLPDDVQREVRVFTDRLYRAFSDGGALPAVRNRHEAYGHIAQGFNTLSGAYKHVKGAVDDCERMLESGETGFVGMATTLYDEMLGLAKESVLFAAFAQSISYDLTERLQSIKTPLEELIPDDAGLLDGAAGGEFDNEEDGEETENG